VSTRPGFDRESPFEKRLADAAIATVNESAGTPELRPAVT
jgi:hypothetical protein